MPSVLPNTSPLSGEDDFGPRAGGSGLPLAALVLFPAALRLSAASNGWPPLSSLVPEPLTLLGLSLCAMLAGRCCEEGAVPELTGL